MSNNGIKSGQGTTRADCEGFGVQFRANAKTKAKTISNRREHKLTGLGLGGNLRSWIRGFASAGKSIWLLAFASSFKVIVNLD